MRAIHLEDHREVAIKIIRSRDIYRISGEKERDVLKMLNEADPSGTTYYIFFFR